VNIKEPTRKHEIPEAGESWMKRKMRPPFRVMFWVLVVCVGFALVMWLIVPVETGDTQHKLPNKPAVSEKRRTERELQRAERTLEHNLAIIHEGWAVPEDHITVFRFRYLLQEIEARTIQSKYQIADMTVNAQQIIIEKRGVKLDLLRMMEEMNSLVKVVQASWPEERDYSKLLGLQVHFWMKEEW
jgi:hypothetical protein